VTTTATELLDAVRHRAHAGAQPNRLVPLIASGDAPLSTVGALAAEEVLIVASDRRSFLHLAARAEEPHATGFLASLGQGESMALATLPALLRATGMTGEYEPEPGCQAYPAYLAWLSLNGAPADVILALLVNFDAWGGYCATVAKALRGHYGLDDEACGFFDFFATPVPELTAQGLAAVQAALDGGADLRAGRRYARLLSAYEISFWNTLADKAA